MKSESTSFCFSATVIKMPTSITVIGHNLISEMTFFCSRFIVFLYCIVDDIKLVASYRGDGAAENFSFWKMKLCEIYGHLIVCQPASEIRVSKSFELLGNWDLSSLSCRPILCSAIFIGITETLAQDGISEICNVCRSVSQTNNSECQGLARSNLSGLSYSSLHFPFIFPSENCPLLVIKSLHSFLKHAHTTRKEKKCFVKVTILCKVHRNNFVKQFIYQILWFRLLTL